MSNLKKLFEVTLGAGIVVLVIGLYFWLVGAGIPYQDPTTKMIIRYMANALAGTMCIKCGAVLSAAGLGGGIIVRMIKRKK